MAGLGTVGGGVVKALRAGPSCRSAPGASSRSSRCRPATAKRIAASIIPDMTWTDDAAALAKSDADVVVELIGGEDGIALAVVEGGAERRKHVVTGNKALLARTARAWRRWQRRTASR